MYIRYHAAYSSPKTGQPVGLFVAVWHLVEHKVLTEEETAEYWRQRQHFEEVLPVPPFYADGNTLGAVTWFKDTEEAMEMVKNLVFYRDMLCKYGVELQQALSENPGKIIYEDQYQIAVIPH